MDDPRLAACFSEQIEDLTPQTRPAWAPGNGGDMTAPAPSEPTWCMAEVEIFQDLSQREMGKMARAAPMRTYAAGELLHTPQEPRQTLFILKHGQVRVFRVAPDGRALTTAILAPGTIFGEMVVVGQQMYDSYAEAVQDVTVCVMSRADVQRFLLSDARIAARIAETLGQRLTQIEMNWSDAVFKTVPQRVASALLVVASSRESRGRGMQVHLTHEHVAALAGTSRETATRTLGDFAKDGLVTLGRGRIGIIDAAGLARAGSGE